jgi:hypothetical protein
MREATLIMAYYENRDMLAAHYIHDASTTRYARKTPADAAIRDIKGQRARIAGWRPVTLSFPFERVF